MKRIPFHLAALCAALSLSVFSGPDAAAGPGLPALNPTSCTSIMVGRKASADGSVITSHTCDGNYRTWMRIVPAAEWPKDTTVAVYGGRMHTESARSTTGLTVRGTIPQASRTLRYLDSSYPCLNEAQLAMGETTISGRKELVNPKGMFMIEELQRIALERCTTARDAIRLMGELIREYGYGDWGECLTIADKHEVWHFEVFGEGPDRIGGVWAAVRIPDGHVGVSANISRISEIRTDRPDECMASENVFEVARKMGFWDGKKPFRFWEAYSGGNYFGEKKAFHIREYFILNTLAPSLGLSYDAEELPLSVKPDRPVSAEDVMLLLAETYEGTPWDAVQNLRVPVKRDGRTDTLVSPVANPWMGGDMKKLLNTLAPGTVPEFRQVAMAWCSYSTVIQLRDWLPDAVGGVAWVSFDNPAQSPRIPVFSGTTDLPACFDRCGQHEPDESAVLWKFRTANRLATVRWGAAREEMQQAVDRLRNKGFRESRFVEAEYARLLEESGEEAAEAFLTGYTADFTGAAVLQWDELARTYWKRFGRGF